MKHRILYFINTDTFLLSHFVGTVLAAKNAGHEVIVLGKATSQERQDKIKSLGLTFIDTGIQRSSVNPLSELGGLRKLLKLYQQFQPTIVHHYGPKSILYGSLVALRTSSKPYIVNNLTGLGFVFCSQTLKAKILKFFVKIGYRYLLTPNDRTTVICENREDIKMFIEMGATTEPATLLIPGAGVNTEQFRSLSDEQKEKNITVVMCARLLKDKGAVEFVEACQRLQHISPKIQFWLIGDIDPSNPNSVTKEEWESWKEIPNLECKGFIADPSPLFNRAHIACLPSFYREGLPKTLLEGAASGLPIVTTDNIGCREVVRANNGILVPIKNSEALAKAIEYLAMNAEIRREYGENSRQLALKEFDERVINRRVLDLYESIH